MKKVMKKFYLSVAYIVGLSLGIHLLVVQVISVAGFIYYFKKFEYDRKTFFIAFALTCGSFVVVYPIIVIWYPTWLSGDIKSFKIDNSSVVMWLAMLIVPAILYGLYWAYKNKKRTWLTHLHLVQYFLIFLGYSIYTRVIIKSKC